MQSIANGINLSDNVPEYLSDSIIEILGEDLMVNHIQQWLEPPFFSGDEEKTHNARFINTIGVYFLCALIIAAVIFVPFFVQPKVEAWAVIFILFIVYGTIRYFLFRGQISLALLSMIVAVWAIFQIVAVIAGGIV